MTSEWAGERRDSETGSGLESGGRPPFRRDKCKERLNTELLRAAAAGDRHKLLRLLESGASSSARCRESLSSALHVGAARGWTGVVEALLGAGGDAAARDRLGRQPHHLAAATGHPAALAALLAAAPALVDSQLLPPSDQTLSPLLLDSWNHRHEEFHDLLEAASGEGRTALHLAADAGDAEAVRLLLEAGASTKVSDASGLLPLDVAGQHSHGGAVQAVCRLLLEYGSEFPKTKVIVKDGRVIIQRRKVTPLHTAVSRGDLELAEFLLGAGACPLAWDEEGRAAAHLAVGGRWERLLRALVGAGGGEARDWLGRTPLLQAVQDGWDDGVALLLEAGADIAPVTSDGQNLLHLATQAGRPALLQELFSIPGIHKILDQTNNSHETPLAVAVKTKNLECVKLLCDQGANPNVHLLPGGQSLLHVAVENGSPEIVRYLLQAAQRSQTHRGQGEHANDLLDEAVEDNSLERASLTKGARGFTIDKTFSRKMDYKRNQGQSMCVDGIKGTIDCQVPFLIGSDKTYLKKQVEEEEMMELLEERKSMTPLHLAAAEGLTECCEVLLRGGADPRAATSRGDRPLHLAAKGGHAGAARLLVGWDREGLAARNLAGWTPLQLAAAEGNTAAAKTLILLGADLAASVSTQLGHRSALDILCSSVPKPADFLRDTFNEYVQVIQGPVNHPDCRISLDFAVLMPNGQDAKQMNVIGAIMNSNRQSVIDTIMIHPLIECFLYLKWNKYKYFFFFLMLLYLVLTISLTVISHLTFVEMASTNLYKTVAIVSRLILFMVLVPIILVEVANLCQLQRHYFTDYESWVKWTVIGCTAVVEAVSTSYHWSRYLASVAVLLSWIEMLFLLARCPSWGFYVLMFSRVATEILKILITFSFLILGFAFSFVILFEAQFPFRNMLEAIVKVLVMMIEFDYEDMFNGATGDLFSVVGRLLFASFVLLVAMVMMNLMLGVAVSDIGRLQSQGRTQQLAKQAAFLAFLEGFFYTRSGRSRFPRALRKVLRGRQAVPSCILLKPGKPFASQVQIPRSHLENVLFNLKTRHVEKVQITESLRDLSDRIDRVAEALKGFYADQKPSGAVRNS